MAGRVEVHWDDPWAVLEAWTLAEDIKTHKPNEHVSIGYVIPNKEHGMGKHLLVLAGTRSGTGHYGNITVIHKSLISKQRAVK